MQYSPDEYTVSIHHNYQHEKDLWMYTIRHGESGQMLYRGFCKTALEAVDTVEQYLAVLRRRRSA